MLKKFAAEAFGISDIGKIIDPADYNKVDSDDYVMHEDNEKIYFLIKSKTDEYCFTNLALIHIDGTSAVSSKRVLRRYDYCSHPIDEVFLETAGSIDLDVEIKFTIGNQVLSIDVDKKQLAPLKDLYKTLIRISQIVKENHTMMNYRQNSIKTATSVLASLRSETTQVSEAFEQINQYAFNWDVATRAAYHRKDFGDVFEKYINN